MNHHAHAQDYSDDSSILESNLNHLVLSPNSNSAYGGVTPTPSGHHHPQYDHDYDRPTTAGAQSFKTARESFNFSPPPPSNYPHQHWPSPTFIPQPPPPSHHSSSSQPNLQHNSDGLPAFSRWSPTWVSGGVSDDGRGFTSHAPPPSSVPHANSNRPYPSSRPAQTHFKEEDDDDEGLNGWIPEVPFVGEFNEPGGNYELGVGFEKPTSTLGSKKQKKIKDQLKRLEKDFRKSNLGEPEGESLKDRMKRIKVERKREKIELRERSGVDSKGRLVVLGQKKRAAMRWLQAVGALIVAFGSLGTALVRSFHFLVCTPNSSSPSSFQLVHPKLTPSQAHSIPLYVLYVLPILSFLLTSYLFLIRPYCLHKNLPTSPHSPQGNNFVIPLIGGNQQQQQLGGPGGDWCCCGGGRKKNSEAAKGGQTVNLLVDPSLFAQFRQQQKSQRPKKPKRRRKPTPEKDGNDSSSSSSTTSTSSDSSDAWSTTSDPTHNPRKGILSAIALEGRWKAARSWMKKLAWIDLAMALVWLGVGGWAIGWEGSCPPGTGEGWWLVLFFPFFVGLSLY